MIKSRRRWLHSILIENKQQCELARLEWTESPFTVSVKGYSMEAVKQFTSKEQRSKNWK